MSVGLREVFNEVHGNGVPRAFGDWELLEESVGFVSGCLGTLAGGTGVAEFLHEGPKVGPNVFPSDYREGFVLSGVSGEDVIMVILEDSESEVVHVRDVNPIVMTEETTIVQCPVGGSRSREVSRGKGINGKG